MPNVTRQVAPTATGANEGNTRSPCTAWAAQVESPSLAAAKSASPWPTTPSKRSKAYRDGPRSSRAAPSNVGAAVRAAARARSREPRCSGTTSLTRPLLVRSAHRDRTGRPPRSLAPSSPDVGGRGGAARQAVSERRSSPKTISPSKCARATSIHSSVEPGAGVGI